MEWTENLELKFIVRFSISKYSKKILLFKLHYYDVRITWVFSMIGKEYTFLAENICAAHWLPNLNQYKAFGIEEMAFTVVVIGQ